MFSRRAAHGVGPKRGPGMRLGVDKKTVGDGLRLLKAVMIGLREVDDPEDGRKKVWFVEGPLPEVRLSADGHPRVNSWQDLVYLIRQVIQGKSVLLESQ